VPRLDATKNQWAGAKAEEGMTEKRPRGFRVKYSWSKRLSRGGGAFEKSTHGTDGRRPIGHNLTGGMGERTWRTE